MSPSAERCTNDALECAVLSENRAPNAHVITRPAVIQFYQESQRMNNTTKAVSIETLDQIATIQRCMSAVADLMNPEKDLHAVNRDNLATLLEYFSSRLAELT